MEKILKADKIEEFTPGKGVRVEGIEKLEGIPFVVANGIHLSCVLGAWYNKYTQSGALDISIQDGSVIGAAAVLCVLLDGNAITITGATKDPKSDDASTTSGETDRYTFWKDATGIYYSITNLGTI